MGMRVSVSEVINAPADVVYSLVVDLPRMGEWSPEATGGRWLEGGGPQVGARFVGSNRTGRRHWSTLVRVTAAEPNRRFAFRVTAPLVPIADWEYRIEPTESGCRIDETFVDLRLPPVRLVSTLRTGVADRSLFNRHSMQVTLAALRERSEASAAAH
jgi:hypothetical protein